MAETRLTDPARRLFVVAVFVLALGLATSVFVYLTAEEDTGNVLGYVIVDGKAYPVRHEDSKMYRHDLELYGGKLNVVMDEFFRGFMGLWRGKTLAFTITVITVFISLAVALAARHISIRTSRNVRSGG